MKAGRSVEVGAKPGMGDALGEAVKRDIEQDLLIRGVKSVSYVDAYEFRAELPSGGLREAAEKLFADPITQDFSVNEALHKEFDWEITVRFHEDVTDNVGMTAAGAVNDLLGTALGKESIRTARKYVLTGSVNEKRVEIICKKLLANGQIETFSYMKGEGGRK